MALKGYFGILSHNDAIEPHKISAMQYDRLLAAREVIESLQERGIRNPILYGPALTGALTGHSGMYWHFTLNIFEEGGIDFFKSLLDAKPLNYCDTAGTQDILVTQKLSKIIGVKLGYRRVYGDIELRDIKIPSTDCPQLLFGYLGYSSAYANIMSQIPPYLKTVEDKFYYAKSMITPAIMAAKGERKGDAIAIDASCDYLYADKACMDIISNGRFNNPAKTEPRQRRYRPE